MTAPLLDTNQAAWLQSGLVSVIAAAPMAGNRPTMTVSFGVRFAADMRVVTIFVGATAGSELIAAVHANAPIAVVFTESLTARSIQFKAERAAIVALEPGDRERMRAYVGAIAQQWALSGQSPEWTRTLLDPDADTVVAIQFTPYVAFDQTPGPQAGTVLADPR